MSQPRPQCKRCQYPQKTCVCSAVASVNSRSAVDILQHPSEQKAAKNTARLVALCVDNARIWQGEQNASFALLRQQLSIEVRPVVVVYPSAQSQSLTTLLSEHFIHPRDGGNRPRAMRFLFLDGTWKKAFKLWQLNPWLQRYPSVHIESAASQYHIRKAPHAHCLSTLEAVAHCLEQTEHCNVQPLYDCLHKMMAPFSERRQSLTQPEAETDFGDYYAHENAGQSNGVKR
ncbi:MAG TPA: tRNA-uridine aminocarboxypropyltransferase [Marinagarivorans sp.]